MPRFPLAAGSLFAVAADERRVIQTKGQAAKMGKEVAFMLSSPRLWGCDCEVLGVLRSSAVDHLSKCTSKNKQHITNGRLLLQLHRKDVLADLTTGDATKCNSKHSDGPLPNSALSF